MAQARRRKRQRGYVEELKSGALRVKVYAGRDPVSKRDVYLSETVPPGPKAAKHAEEARTRLLNQVDEKRNPRTRATVDQLLDRWVSVINVDPSTLRGYEGKIRKHIRPLIGRESPLLVRLVRGERASDQVGCVDRFVAVDRGIRSWPLRPVAERPAADVVW
jgi:hypothetical protein